MCGLDLDFGIATGDHVDEMPASSTRRSRLGVDRRADAVLPVVHALAMKAVLASSASTKKTAQKVLIA